MTKTVTIRNQKKADQQALGLILRYRSDPVLWAETVLGITLSPYQKRILISICNNRRTSIRSASATGKTFTAAVAVLWFLYNFYPSTVVTTAPTFRQVKELLWREISSLWNNATFSLGTIAPSGTSLDLTREPNSKQKHYAIGYSTNEPERFQGTHNEYVLVIVDEASGVDEMVFNAIENPMAGGKSKLLLIGNPTQTQGTFFESHRSEIYESFRIGAFDTPNFVDLGIVEEDMATGAWLEKQEAYLKEHEDLPSPYLVRPDTVHERYIDWGQNHYLYKVYVLGDFPDVGVNQLIPLSWVENAEEDEEKIAKLVDNDKTAYAGVDISRYGEDETVFMMRRGNVAYAIEAWAHQLTTYTMGRTTRHMKSYEPYEVRADSVGLGAGVVDVLKENGFRVKAVNVGLPAVDAEMFLNLRAEYYWNLKERFRKGDIVIPVNKKLRNQLSSIQYTFRSNGQLKIESKEEMRDRGVASPDYADALLLAFIPEPVDGGYREQEGWG